MAKELPYFKFIATEWLTGNIIYESLEVQGLFINICALYWQRGGVLTLSEVEYRWKKKNTIAKLCDRFISQCDGIIKIAFLDEQLNERQYVSKKNADNAKDGWKKRRDAKPCDPIANECNIEQEEEKKENKKRIKEEGSQARFPFKEKMIEYGFKESLVDDWLKVRKTKKSTNSQTAFNQFINEIEKRACHLNDTLEIIVAKSWAGFSWEWVDNKNEKNGSGTSKQGKKEQIGRAHV